jgi:hypothetical protein
MSPLVASLRDMRNDRRSRRRKKARREAVRAKTQIATTPTNSTLSDIIRKALARRHPGHLLVLACTVVNAAGDDSGSLDRFLSNLIGVRNRETTALLAVMAELLVDDEAARLRCRQALADRHEHLPKWITALPRADVYRAVRRSRELGDVDELFIGLRLERDHELTVGVVVDHIEFSGIADAVALAAPIDGVLTDLGESDSDTDVSDLSLADARVWIEDALTRPTFAKETDTWPLCRPLVRWLVGQLPKGGDHRLSATAWRRAEELCDGFFATDSAAPFTDASHRDLLLELFETGSGDPLRWSASRVGDALGGSLFDPGHIAVEVALDAPDLLRAFIPYAHAQSGIRDELTSRALAVIDAQRSRYKRDILNQVMFDGLDDAV